MVKIAINGFGRIGRLSLRELFKLDNYEVVAINDLTSPKILAYLLKYDSTHNKFNYDISYDDNNIIIDGKKIRIFSEKDPINLPWKDLNIDIVLECTGRFKNIDQANKHIIAGAKKVIVSAPSDAPIYIYNVNHNEITNENIISAGSCTTNALAPAAKIINDNYIIENGFMITTHAYTNDQELLDLANPNKDLRRSRAAENIVPTSTGAAKSIGRVIKDLDGKLDGVSNRVPVKCGSLVELICKIKKDTSINEINNLFKINTNETLGYNDEEIVSSDILGTNYGCIFDSTLTKVINNNFIKISLWYDNEMSFTSQMIRLCKYIGDKL